MIPRPQKIEAHGGECFLPQMLRYQCNGLSSKEARQFGGYLLSWLRDEYERSDYQAPPGELGLSLEICPTGLEHPEGYLIEISDVDISLRAARIEGFRHGYQSLLQLLYTAVWHHGGLLPCQRIEDWPRYEWRGLHLDCSRHFFAVEDVLKYLEWMEALKLNRFHWHLTDDQGWRVESRRFPLLTEKGAWRTDPETGRYGGFYSRDDIARVVNYAQEMGIEVIPEVDLPGHAMAILSAYPDLACFPREFEPLSVWGISEDILCAGKDATLDFLKELLTEVAELFPGPWLHIGGDEAPKQRWKACPACQKRIMDQGLKDEEELQSWLIKELQTHLKTLGKTLIGWDEILEGGIAPEATVMSWRGIDGAVAAAKAGHDAVLSPSPALYLDNRQGFGPLEPPGRGNLIDLASVYRFDPAPAAIPAEARRHILGVQANLWTEHVRTEQRAAWMMFPRANALAEVAWWPGGSRDFAGFVARLVPQLDRMRALGLKPAASAFAVTTATDFTPGDPHAIVTLADQAGLPLRYTTDGSAPTAASPLYAGPLTVMLPTRLRAAAMFGARAMPGASGRTAAAVCSSGR